MGFKKDLKIGMVGEDFVIEIFKKAKIEINRREKLVQYDLIFQYNQKEWKIEVKYDVYSEKSGNIALEYHNPKLDKPSGLYATEANFWIHILTNPNRAYIIETEKLKQFINSHKPLRIIEVGGDGNASLMLYKINSIIHIFKELTSKNIREILDEKCYC